MEPRLDDVSASNRSTHPRRTIVRWRVGLLGLVLAPPLVLGSCDLLSVVLSSKISEQEAYSAAAGGVLLERALAANDPALIRRDFTLSWNGANPAYGSGPLFTACSVGPEDLVRELTRSKNGWRYSSCSTDPGPFATGPRCWKLLCVVVAVTPETWADARARTALVATLRDWNAVCRYTRKYGPNHDRGARAIGCDRRRHWLRVRPKIAVVSRPLKQPCYRSQHYQQFPGGVHGYGLVIDDVCSRRDAYWPEVKL